ncbi:V-type ATP synthase subunit I [Acidilobus saccharovorans 345-15]|uniref:A-type ATP synthase subunit I n=1 Tax=Acidilobus saccharovorans (strain DSM 16705 / JCM 18335 / VKM B-2471 / 345-15) TaxID=666510 RepID=D9Q0I5_ACIS3|nr:V-type ATP synthase subunit I [Acidilobus saccharovorans]ADL18823.1 V-type ATP synthase subunit I [Acidilobus saccharovorans 345-15]
MIIANRLEEVLIAIPNEQYDRAVAALASLGIFHVEEPSGDLSRYVNRSYRRLMTESTELKSRLEGFFKTAGLAPSSNINVTIKVSSWEETFNSVVKVHVNLEKDLEKLSARATELTARIAELQNIALALEPFKGLSSDVRSAWEGGNIKASAGIVSAAQLDNAISIASRRGLLYAIELIGKDTAIFAVAGEPGQVRDATAELTRSLGWRQLVLPPELPGSPSQAASQVSDELSKLSSELEDIKSDIKKRLPELEEYYAEVSALSEVFKILSYSAKTETITFIHGFVDTKDSKKLRESLDACCNGSYMVLSLGFKRGESYVPSKVELPGYFRWFQSIVDMYGTPSNNEIVPTLFLAITMPIIFGLMFPDIGHGLLVLLFAALYILPRDRNLGKVVVVLGAAGMVAGFFAGEFFGPIPAHFVGLDSLWRSLGFKVPPLESPVAEAYEHPSSNYTMLLFDEILDLSFWIGGFMLVFGNALGVADDLISHDYEDLVARRAPLLLLFLAADLPFLAYFNAYRAGYVIELAVFDLGRGGPMEAFVFYGGIASVIWLVLGDGLYKASVGEGFRLDPYESFLGVFEGLIMALGNTISFLRIMGLSLAHAGLMVGFTVLTYVVLTAHPTPYTITAAAVIYIIGNLLTAGLEGIVAFAHDLRLHFYEWFNKFYRGLGVPFNPIRVPGVTFVILPTSS